MNKIFVNKKCEVRLWVVVVSRSISVRSPYKATQTNEILILVNVIILVALNLSEKIIAKNNET